MITTDHSLHFVRGCSHCHHLASDFDSHEWTAVKSVCGCGGTAYAHAYAMKHTVGVAVWRGLAVGQMEPRNLFNENFVESYPRNLSSVKLRRYTVGDIVMGRNFFTKCGSYFVPMNYDLSILCNICVYPEEKRR